MLDTSTLYVGDEIYGAPAVAARAVIGNIQSDGVCIARVIKGTRVLAGMYCTQVCSPDNGFQPLLCTLAMDILPWTRLHTTRISKLRNTTRIERSLSAACLYLYLRVYYLTWTHRASRRRGISLGQDMPS